MIIDKVTPHYWTEEDVKRLNEATSKLKKTSEYVADLITKDPEGKNTDPKAYLNDMELLDRLREEQNKIYAEVEDRYIKSKSKKELLEDVKEIVNSVEKEDFLNHVSDIKKEVLELQNNGSWAVSDLLEEYGRENYENCYSFILHFLRVQLNAFENDEEATDKIKALVAKRTSLWYIKRRPAYIPLAHGKATDTFAFMSTKNAQIDKVTKNGTIDSNGVKLAIAKLDLLHATLGINTDKLLSTAISVFTQQNDFRHLQNAEPKRDIIIDFKEYAKELGYDIEEHKTGTPEEAEAEKKRVKNQLDNARKAIRKDLDIIHASTLTWEEPIKGKNKDFARVSLVTFTGIKNGQIKISFSPELANYLVQKNIITQYPVKLLRLKASQRTAYYIGRKLAEHYNIDNNQIRGTHDRISIPALLAKSGLASYETIQKSKDRGHWIDRIKEPFEKALDTLTQEGILKDWKYTHEKGIELTEEEAYNINSYEEFSKLYLNFTLADKVDHTDRLEAKKESKKTANKKKS